MFAATIIVFCMSRLIGDPLLLYAQAGGYGMPPEQKEYLRQYLGLDKSNCSLFVVIKSKFSTLSIISAKEVSS